MQHTLHHHFSSSSSSSPFNNNNNHHPAAFPSSILRPKHIPLLLLLHLNNNIIAAAAAKSSPSPSPTNIISLPSLPKHHHQHLHHPQLISPADSQIQEILLFLDSLGVDSFYCLHSHPPLISTPLSQIKSTVDFLFSIGLTLHDLRRIFPMCPDLLTSSTSATIIPATTFLLREAGVPAPDLRRVIHRRPRLLVRHVERELRPTLYFLQGTIGIDDVSKWASLLSCSVESKFVPRIDYLQKLGFSYRETVGMFRRFPALFCYSIKGNFEPKFDYFVVEMGRELKELVAFPHYFSFSLDKRIKPRHGMCVEKGVCLALPTMLKLSDAQFRERLEVCCNSSAPPVTTSPLWYKTKTQPQPQPRRNTQYYYTPSTSTTTTTDLMI